jgi:Zn2+/Cd2+-exporting ATPase
VGTGAYFNMLVVVDSRDFLMTLSSSSATNTSHHHHTHGEHCDLNCGHDHGSSFTLSKGWVLFSAVLTGVGCLIEAFSESEPWYLPLLFIGVVGIVGTPIALRALVALSEGRGTISVLMTIAAVGACVIGEFSEAASVVVLYTLAEWLEHLTMQRAQKAIVGLVDTAVPPTAFVRRGIGLIEVPLESVSIGEVLVVKAHVRIPLDGIVEKGTSSVDESVLTGESSAVVKAKGDLVYGGTLNQEGSLDIRVTRSIHDTTIARIRSLVSVSQQRRSRAERVIDEFARWYTPTVVILSGLLFLVSPWWFALSWSDSFYRALNLLVIACPCALVISTPISLFASITTLARRGVVVKGGEYLELLGRVTTVAFDKTGTLTMGRPEVVGVHSFGELSEMELESIASSISLVSTHPIARALVRHAKERSIPVVEVTQFESVPGQGSFGKIEDYFYFIGSHRVVHEKKLCSEALDALIDEEESQSRTSVVVARGTTSTMEHFIIQGIIVLADKVRDEAHDTISGLKKRGITSLPMISGDNEKSVASLAHRLCLPEFYGSLMPEEKLEKIQEFLEYRAPVAMVGDGINDAPALAAASVGVAIHEGHHDTLLESAHVILMGNDLTLLLDAVDGARRAKRVIYSNIALALGVKLGCAVLTLAGLSNLWLALFADMGTTILVVAYSLTLLVPRPRAEHS